MQPLNSYSSIHKLSLSVFCKFGKTQLLKPFWGFTFQVLTLTILAGLVAFVIVGLNAWLILQSLLG